MTRGLPQLKRVRERRWLLPGFSLNFARFSHNYLLRNALQGNLCRQRGVGEPFQRETTLRALSGQAGKQGKRVRHGSRVRRASSFSCNCKLQYCNGMRHDVRTVRSFFCMAAFVCHMRCRHRMWQALKTYAVPALKKSRNRWAGHANKVISLLFLPFLSLAGGWRRRRKKRQRPGTERTAAW